MCAAPNLATLTYWHAEAQSIPENSFNYTIENNGDDGSKIKFMRRPMFIVNHGIHKEEPYPNYEAKNCCEPLSDKLTGKHFVPPLDSFHLTPEECNEILMKRAALAAEKESKPSPAKMRPYSCTECGKTFLLKHHLTTHAKVHSGIRPHSCTHCGKSFTHKHCLNTHLLLHTSQRPYQCPECKKSFTLKHHLLTHSRVHSRDRPFVCTECGRSFPLKRHLVTHSKFHAGERPFICEDCGESFAQKDHLVMHSRFHGSLNSFVCSDCGAPFTRKFELVNHWRLHGRVPHSCPICNKEFLQKRTLVTHMRYHTAESPFACLHCGEAFHTKNELIMHSKTHTSSNHVKLSCQECGSAFNNPEALTLHVKLHSGDTSLLNDLCALTASLQNVNIPIAINGVNGNVPQVIPNEIDIKPPVPTVKIKSHICQFCTKAFSAKHGLQQHNRRHPEGTCSLRSHICDICSKGFFQKNHLLLHQRQHMDPNLRNGKIQESPPARVDPINYPNREEEHSSVGADGGEVEVV